MSAATAVCLLLVGLCCFAQSQPPTPATIAKRVIDGLINYDDTHHYFLSLPEYGSTIVYAGIWEASNVLGLDYTAVLNDHLDQFSSRSGSLAYNALHNVTIPWAYDIGDQVGLFPFAYLGRLEYYNHHPNSSYNNKTDLDLAVTIADRYILKWPKRIPDGCVSRQDGWPGEKVVNATFVWADDTFMGLTVPFRLAKLLKRQEYADWAANQLVLFDKHLFDQNVGLMIHGYNDDDQHISCCRWSRANGWTMMAHAEALLSLTAFPNSPYKQQLLSTFQTFAEGARKVQSDKGLWHEVVDVPSTWLETSVSSMFLFSLVHGVENGWLDRTTFQPVIDKAWEGIASTVQSDGTVTGICEGTGIGGDLQFYEGRSNAYSASQPGLGSVIRAAAAMGSLSRN